MGFTVAQSQAQCDKNKSLKTEKTNANKQISGEKTDKDMPEKQTKFENLPQGVKLTDEVREDIKVEDGKVIENKIIKVEEKLRKIGAKYEDGKLVDGNGREIRFYRPPMYGMSGGYDEDQKRAKRDAEELKKLQEKYTVIILEMNPFDVPY
jgi:hypothetical protein